MQVRKPLLVALSFIMVLTILSIDQAFTTSSAPPVGRTGAPGEQTCNTAGCHNGNTTIMNSTTITLAGQGANNINNGFAASTAYNMALNVSASGSGAPLYGFSMTAVDENGDGVGTLTAITPNGIGKLTDGGKEYLGHSPASSATAYAIRWESPATLPAEVYFYIAVNYSNNDGLASGDQIAQARYKATTSGFGLSTGVQSINVDEINTLNVFPNPAVDHVNIEIMADQSSDITAELYDVQGRKIQNLINSSIMTGNNYFTANFSESLSKGLYMVKINTDGNSYFKKLYVQ